MKQLFLVRHAEALHDKIVPDYKRQLSPSGKQDALEMANRALTAGYSPDIVISSPAMRAKETADIFSEILNFPPDSIDYRKILYDSANIDSLLNLIAETGDEHETLMIFGHNPTLTELAKALSVSCNNIIPTAGVVGIELSIESWNQIAPGDGELIYFDTPHRKIL